jgi:phage terminase large subunit
MHRIKTLRGYNLFVTSESVNLIKEFRYYKFKEDKNGNFLDEPVKEFDHALDAAGYAVIHKTKKRNAKVLAV